MAKKKSARKTARKAGAKRSLTWSARKRPSTKAAAGSRKPGSAKRETLSRGGKDVAYAKRRLEGTFKEVDDVSRSLSSNRRRTAKTKAQRGHGDQGHR